MPLSDSVRDWVVFLGGEVAGINCPDCGLESRDVDIDAHTIADVACPECGAVALTEGQKSELRQAGKL